MELIEKRKVKITTCRSYLLKKVSFSAKKPEKKQNLLKTTDHFLQNIVKIITKKF